MDTSKAIDISKSSLVGLKAELLKKQEEVKKLKEFHKDIIKPAPQIQKSKECHGINIGVEGRNLRDIEQTEDDFDLLQKSRKLLEEKARLYDKLKLNEGDSKAKTQYLIDFELKQEIYSNDKNDNPENDKISQISEDEDAYSDLNSDPENDWVDFVDILGRSRRCLKKDLPDMKIKDANLAASLRPASPLPVAEVTPELLSWDMQREIMRKKWEEQETLLLGKKDVHYQDVLFDETRPHGVGYFSFSTEESERMRQQQELKNMRKETMEQQEAAVGLRLRRQQQLEARLAAARRRRRQRLGLPPDDSEPPEAEVRVSTPEEEEQSTENIEDLQESIKKIIPIRPWDIGKQDAVMSQEEWVEKKRSERPEEFAPPSSLMELPTLKNKTIHEFENDLHDKTELVYFKKSLKVPITTNTDLFKNNHKEDMLKPKNTFLQLQCDNAYNNNNCNIPVKNISECHPQFKNRKPSSQDIDKLLSKSKEIYYCGSEVKNPTRKQNISRKKVYTESKPINCDVFVKETDCIIPTISNLYEKVNETNGLEHVTQKRMQDTVNELTRDDCFETSQSTKKKRGAEIPPPPSMSYHIDGSSSHKQHTSSKTDLLESISVGLNFLKSKEKKKTRVKGLLDIM